MLRTLSRVEVTERMTSEEFFRYAPNDKKVEKFISVRSALGEMGVSS